EDDSFFRLSSAPHVVLGRPLASAKTNDNAPPKCWTTNRSFATHLATLFQHSNRRRLTNLQMYWCSGVAHDRSLVISINWRNLCLRNPMLHLAPFGCPPKQRRTFQP